MRRKDGRTEEREGEFGAPLGRQPFGGVGAEEGRKKTEGEKERREKREQRGKRAKRGTRGKRERGSTPEQKKESRRKTNERKRKKERETPVALNSVSGEPCSELEDSPGPAPARGDRLLRMVRL